MLASKYSCGVAKGWGDVMECSLLLAVVNGAYRTLDIIVVGWLA